ncbi:MAG: hypothetical protein OXD30_02700, partial [Bryobacterales bacterium]|nr:hypothetical protein [Bryobacterales bacterium]
MPGLEKGADRGHMRGMLYENAGATPESVAEINAATSCEGASQAASRVAGSVGKFSAPLGPSPPCAGFQPGFSRPSERLLSP